MFTTIEIMDPKVFYVNRPIRFKVHKHNEISKWRYGLVHYIDYTRIEVIYSCGTASPGDEYISMDDIKSGKTEIALLGDDK